MNLGILFCLIIAHLLADFVFQTQSMLHERRSIHIVTMLKGNMKHSAIHGLLSFFLLLYYIFSWRISFVILLVFFSHTCIDLIKSFITAKKQPNLNIVFLVDQFAHFIVIVLIAIFANSLLDISLPALRVKDWVIHSLNGIQMMTYNQKLLLCIALLITGLWGVGVFIRKFVEGMKLKTIKKGPSSDVIILEGGKEQSVRDGGFLIGILERFVIICAVVTNMTSIIGFLITAKSIARFKKFDDDSFVEYFIIGSFMSIISAIIIGLMIRQLNIFVLQ